MGGPSVFLTPRGCRHGVGAQHVTGEASQQRVLTTDTPGSVHNKLSGGVIPDDRLVMGLSQCTGAPDREPDLDLEGTHGVMPLEDLDIL